MIKPSTLKLLIDMLNDNGITWGVGGSFLLQVHELYSEPNDLDLWVQPSDIPRVRNIFHGYDEIKTNIQLPEEMRFKMLFHDMEVDFVSCFMTKPNRNKFVYQIKPCNIRIVKLSYGVDVPCTLLEDWYIIYRLLRRNDKAELIRQVFEKKNIDINKNAIELAVSSKENKLPRYFKRDIPRLVYAARQYSIFDYILK